MDLAANSQGHVFVSYVREDRHDVDWLQSFLEASGIRVWRDTTDLLPGEDWQATIRRAITDDAFVFIACFSRRSLARDKSYQNQEFNLAIEQLRLRRPDVPWLIPVCFDDCSIPDLDIGGGRTLASIHRADLFGEGRDQAVSQLVTAVLRILGPRSAASTRRSSERYDSRYSSPLKRALASGRRRFGSEDHMAAVRITRYGAGLTILALLLALLSQRWPLLRTTSAVAIAASAAIGHGRRLRRPWRSWPVTTAAVACTVACVSLASSFVPWTGDHLSWAGTLSTHTQHDRAGRSASTSYSGPPKGACVDADICRYLRLGGSQQFDLDQWATVRGPRADLTLADASQLRALGSSGLAITDSIPSMPANPQRCRAVKHWVRTLALPPIGSARCIRTSDGHLVLIVRVPAPSIRLFKFIAAVTRR